MTAHAGFRDLAATALDFELDALERRELDAHLDACADCRAYAATLRSDGAWIRALPAPGAPDRVRRAVLGSGTRPARRPSLRAAVAVLVLVLVPVGAAAIALRDLSFGLGIGAAPGAPAASEEPGGGWGLVVPTETDGAGGATPGPPAASVGATGAPASAAPTAPSSEAPVGAVRSLAAVTWAEDQGWVAVGDACPAGGDACAAAVMLSGDARTWRRVDEPGLALDPLPCCDQAGMRDVTTFRGGLVAVGATAAGERPRAALWSSDGGDAWSRDGADDPTTSGWANGVTAMDDRRVVAVGGDRLAGGVRAAVWWSDDGRTWRRVDDGPALDAGAAGHERDGRQTPGMHDVAWDGSRLVAVGARCDGDAGPCRGVAWTSEDGLAWAAAPDAFGFGIPAEVALVDGRFVAVGRDADLPRAWSSADGRAWQPVPVDEVPAGQLLAVAPGADGAVAGGASAGEQPTAVIWTLGPDGWMLSARDGAFEGAVVEGLAAGGGGVDGLIEGGTQVVVAVGRGEPGGPGLIWRLERVAEAEP